ncbi:hypothetical protein BC829DRAFT_408586 [Chytridium lagenaria]|nr:hypothetical protein BC829DRAFT_408586 [Chytridium lagenaria]
MFKSALCFLVPRTLITVLTQFQRFFFLYKQQSLLHLTLPSPSKNLQYVPSYRFWLFFFREQTNSVTKKKIHDMR